MASGNLFNSLIATLATHWATESARVAQPIHFLVFGFKDTLQNTGHEAEEISFVVCDVNSEKERFQVNFLVFRQFERNFSD